MRIWLTNSSHGSEFVDATNMDNDDVLEAQTNDEDKQTCSIVIDPNIFKQI